MTNEIEKSKYCLILKNGIRFWIEEELVDLIKISIKSPGKNFIEIGNEFVGVSDISGIFSLETMENLRREKKGDWKCLRCGEWYPRESNKCINHEW